MEFARQIINSDLISPIIDIPITLKGKNVEIIVLPIEKENKENFQKKSMLGALKQHANITLIKEEKLAWAEVAGEKHVNS